MALAHRLVAVPFSRPSGRLPRWTPCPVPMACGVPVPWSHRSHGYQQQRAVDEVPCG